MKKSVVLVILLACLVGFAWIYQTNRDKRMNSARLVGVPMREYLLPELPVTNIRKIRVREGDQTATLEVKGERWVVEERAGYNAAYEKIDRLVTALSELKITGKNEVGPSAVKELMLLPPSEGAERGTTGVQIELINEKGETLASLVAGGITLTTGGANSDNWMGGVEQRYIRTTTDQNTVWMVKDDMTEWTGDARAWLSKSFITVDGIRQITVKSKDPVTSWVVGRGDPSGPFGLEGGPQGLALDESVTNQLNSLLSAPVFTDVHPKDKAAELLKEPVEVNLITFDGFVYDVKLAKKKEEDRGEEDPDGAGNVYMSFTVNVDVPKQRSVEPGETEEVKKTKDEAFAAAVKATDEKLNREKAFEGWVFELPVSSVEALFKSKDSLLAPPKGAEGSGAPGGNGLPPGFQLPPGLMSPNGRPPGQ